MKGISRFLTHLFEKCVNSHSESHTRDNLETNCDSQMYTLFSGNDSGDLFLPTENIQQTDKKHPYVLRLNIKITLLCIM